MLTSMDVRVYAAVSYITCLKESYMFYHVMASTGETVNVLVKFHMKLVYKWDWVIGV